MNYKTYAEAKIANPDSEIVTTGKGWEGCSSLAGVFQKINDGGKCSIGDNAWVICNPADYCSGLKEFFDAGFKLVAGDKIIGADKSVWDIAEHSEFNHPDENDEEDESRYILSAAALNGGCKIPVKAEQWTVYNNTMPLCELTDERAAMLFNAWRGGDNIQFRAMDVNVWVDKPEHDATIKKVGVYRVKPKSERELFIDKSLSLMTSETERTMEQMFGAQFDSGARYKDLTHHFGENI